MLHRPKDSEVPPKGPFHRSPPEHSPLIEAHRGDSANAPENTIAAFERALGIGVACIELDVHPARDGTLMVIHDDTVDRTTDGRGAVRGLTVNDLLRLDAGRKFSPSYAGERIPRLIDVLELAKDQATRLNIEIKSSPAGVDVPLAVVDLLRQFGKLNDSIVSSFDLQALLDVRKIAPEITLAIIGNGPEILALALLHQFPWIHAKHTTITGHLVVQAHSQSIRVNAWTVDDPATLPDWAKTGVDKICTNQPARMLDAATAMEGECR